jgi:hypothetical protein
LVSCRRVSPGLGRCGLDAQNAGFSVGAGLGGLVAGGGRLFAVGRWVVWLVESGWLEGWRCVVGGCLCGWWPCRVRWVGGRDGLVRLGCRCRPLSCVFAGGLCPCVRGFFQRW